MGETPMINAASRECPHVLHARINESNWPAKAGQFTFRVIAIVPASSGNVFEVHRPCDLRRGQSATAFGR